MSAALANAVRIRRALRATTQRRLAARLRVSPARVNRTVQSIDIIAVMLDALGLEVRPRP